MKLNELLNHLQEMSELCRKNDISPSSVEVVYVPDVMETKDGMIKNKKWITSTHMNALEGELLLFDAASWEQYQKALK